MFGVTDSPSDFPVPLRESVAELTESVSGIADVSKRKIPLVIPFHLPEPESPDRSMTTAVVEESSDPVPAPG